MKRYAREAYDKFTKEGGDTGEEMYKVGLIFPNSGVDKLLSNANTIITPYKHMSCEMRKLVFVVSDQV